MVDATGGGAAASECFHVGGRADSDSYTPAATPPSSPFHTDEHLTHIPNTSNAANHSILRLLHTNQSGQGLESTAGPAVSKLSW